MSFRMYTTGGKKTLSGLSFSFFYGHYTRTDVCSRAHRNWINIYRREFAETLAINLMSLVIILRHLTVKDWVQSQARPRSVSGGAQWHCDRFLTHDCGCPMSLSLPIHPRPMLIHSSLTDVISSETDSVVKSNTRDN